MAALDILEVTHLLDAASRRVPASSVEAAPARPSTTPDTRKRWWFAFDGWRSAEREPEFVLA